MASIQYKINCLTHDISEIQKHIGILASHHEVSPVLAAHMIRLEQKLSVLRTVARVSTVAMPITFLQDAMAEVKLDDDEL